MARRIRSLRRKIPRTNGGLRFDPQSEARRAGFAALEARLMWFFAGAMLAQALAILGGVLAMLRLIR